MTARDVWPPALILMVFAAVLYLIDRVAPAIMQGFP